MLCLGKGGMMSEKAKVDKPGKQRINRYGFLILWVGAQALGWLGYFLITELSLFSFPMAYNNWMMGLLLGITVGIPTALLQKLVLYLSFGRWFRGWVRANSLGWLAGGLAIAAVVEAGLNGQADWTIQVLALMMLPAFAQAWVFRRYFERVWLWLLAAGSASIVFAGILKLMDGGSAAIFPSSAMFASVTGLTLLWLFGMQAKEGKFKNIENTSRLVDGMEDESDSVELEETVQRKVI
jgi:hypothetical protein